MSKLAKARTFSDILTLLLGVGGAQIIGLGAVFLYTRLYAPEHLGLLGIFISVVLVFRLVSTGGYEPAIVLPESDRTAKAILQLCLGISLLVAGLVALLVCFSEQLIEVVYPNSSGNLQKVIWLVPMSLFLESVALILKYWLNRFKEYRAISLARFLQALVTVTVSLLLAWQEYYVSGLILGFVAGQVVQLVVMVWYSPHLFPINWNWQESKSAAKEYRQFLQYGVTSGWLNTLANEAPMLIIPRFFGEAASGIFHVARKIVFAPINLVGSSISTVFFEQASQAHQQGGGRLALLTRSTLRYLLVVSVVPTVILFFWGEELFTLFFGENYRMAGLYASWLSPWILVKFLNHPLSYLVDVKMELKAQFVYNILLFLGQIGVLVALGMLAFAALPSIIAYGMVGFVLSLFYFVFLLKLGEIF